MNNRSYVGLQYTPPICAVNAKRKSPPTFCVRGLAGYRLIGDAASPLKSPSDLLRQRACRGVALRCGPRLGRRPHIRCGLASLDCIANTKNGPATTTCHQPALIRALIVSLSYFACMIASIALMAALRRPFSSREATPLMVVPPGEHTASLSTAGCLPVSTAILPVPAIICPASW